MPRELTKDEEELLEQADALSDMTRTRGWEIFNRQIDGVLDAITAQKGNIPVSLPGPNGPIALPPETIGLDYLALDNKAEGVKAARRQVTSLIKRAEKLRKQLARASGEAPPTG
jgi:hypothetical protein